jgi:hypothetical protein
MDDEVKMFLNLNQLEQWRKKNKQWINVIELLQILDVLTYVEQHDLSFFLKGDF